MFVEVLALASGEAEHKLYQAIESFFLKSAAMMRKHLRGFWLQN